MPTDVLLANNAGAWNKLASAAAAAACNNTSCICLLLCCIHRTLICENVDLHTCPVLFDLQGFHSSDSDDQHSDDEEDHVEGMSGDEPMGEQQDFEGSDGFSEVCIPHRV